jgi:hypothetical protein
VTAIRIESKHRAESKKKQELKSELAFIVSFVVSHDSSLELVVVKHCLLFLLIHISDLMGMSAHCRVPRDSISDTPLRFVVDRDN